MEEINKGGKAWLQFSLDRTSKGLEIFAKVDPQVEEFMIASSGGIHDPLDAFGRTWYNKDKEGLRLYRLEKEMNSPSYLLGNPCGPLVQKGGLQINLTWLQMKGLSNPQGITFVIAGPFGKPFVEDFGKLVLLGCRDFFKNYIVPIHVNLRISSTEI